MGLRSKIVCAAALLPLATGALADDWKITRISGSALVFFDGRWTPLRLGDMVTDTSAIRTMADGSLHFERDHETIDVEPDTEIRIEDRKGQRFTTVHQYFGTVGVEANRENVQHFAVKTPFLAAVVKGTVFAVNTDAKVSAVAVARGKVGVTSAVGPAHGDVGAGETATVSAKGFSMGHGGAAAGAAAAAAAAAAASSASAAASSASAAASSSSSSGGSSSSSGSSSAGSASAAASSAAASASAAASSASASASAAAPASPASPAASAAATAAPSAAASNASAPGQAGKGPHGYGFGFGFGFGHNGFGQGFGHNGAANGHGSSSGGHGGGGR